MFKQKLFLLWGNLFKADLYKLIIYNLWPIIMNYKIIFDEDFIITFFILIYAKRCGFIKHIFIFHYINGESASQSYLNNTENYLSTLFTANLYYDYHIDSNPKDIHILLNYIYWIVGVFKNCKKLYPKLFNFFFGKLLSNDYLSKQDKIKLLNNFNISENCDSYKYIKKVINKNSIKLNIQNNEININNYKTYKLSIIIIISIYNNIIELINSILAQNINFLEIILIYDDINKENYNLFEKFIQSYPNIKLINNKFKKGSLHSICNAIELSKGKYLMILDQNSYFRDDDTLENIYSIIEKDDFDIIEFNLYKILQNKYLNLYKCKHFLTQFNLKQIKFNLEFNEIDIKKELLTNKLIKADFIKYIIKKYKIEEIKENIDLYTNDILTFFIDLNNHKYIYISAINIYKNNSDFEKIRFNIFKSEQYSLISETIFFINFIFDNSENTIQVKEIVLKELFNVLNIIFNKFTKFSKSSIYLINKFFNCEYISVKNKNILKFYYNLLIN